MSAVPSCQGRGRAEEMARRLPGGRQAQVGVALGSWIGGGYRVWLGVRVPPRPDQVVRPNRRPYARTRSPVPACCCSSTTPAFHPSHRRDCQASVAAGHAAVRARRRESRALCWRRSWPPRWRRAAPATSRARPRPRRWPAVAASSRGSACWGSRRRWMRAGRRRAGGASASTAGPTPRVSCPKRRRRWRTRSVLRPGPAWSGRPSRRRGRGWRPLADPARQDDVPEVAGAEPAVRTPAAARDATARPAAVSPRARAEIAALLAAKARRTPPQRKLGSRLLDRAAGGGRAERLPRRRAPDAETSVVRAELDALRDREPAALDLPLGREPALVDTSLDLDRELPPDTQLDPGGVGSGRGGGRSGRSRHAP